MPANASFDKGAAVEEWTDMVFFRPIGLRIAQACLPTRITPDQLTLVALITGLVAGRLLFYNSVRLNAVGVALFIVSDIFDSSDGQLARMRGTSTRFGKILDGVSDGLRFANMYVNLIARLVVAGSAWWLAVPLGVAAGLAHARQSAGVDYIRQLYMYVAESGTGEFNLPADMAAMPAATLLHRAGVEFYRRYLVSASRMFPRSLAVVRQLEVHGDDASLRVAWRCLQAPIVRQCAWIGQNIRFALLALLVIPGHPMAFLWITLLPMTGILVALVLTHEWRASSLLDPDTHRLAHAA